MKSRLLLLAAAMFAVADVHGQANNPSFQVPDDARELRHLKGDGVQIYTCAKVDNGQKWALQRPDAKLLDAKEKVIGTHFAGPTWKLDDGGTVQGESPVPTPSPDKNSVPWLLLRAKAGTATGSLGSVTYITRTETHGGLAPTTGCQNAGDIGNSFPVPYTATYTFYVPK